MQFMKKNGSKDDEPDITPGHLHEAINHNNDIINVPFLAQADRFAS